MVTLSYDIAWTRQGRKTDKKDESVCRLIQVTTVDVLMSCVLAMTQNSEHPFDELRGVILLYGEAEHNRAVPARPQRRHPNRRTSISLERRPLRIRPNVTNASRLGAVGVATACRHIYRTAARVFHQHLRLSVMSQRFNVF
jgi:hypothetical protein